MRKNFETGGRRDPRQVGPDGAGHSGDLQRLSTAEDVDNESVEEMAKTD